MKQKDFLFTNLSSLRPTYENWHPCTPILNTFKGVRFYIGYAVFIFLDGRQVGRLIYTGEPNESYNDVLKKTLKITSEQEKIDIEYALSLKSVQK